MLTINPSGRRLMEEDWTMRKIIIFFITFIVCLFPNIVSSAPMILDPSYSISLVATGLGGAGGMAIDNEGNIFINDYRDHGTGSGRIHWFKPNWEHVTINTNIYYSGGIAVLPNGNLLVGPGPGYEVTRDGSVSSFTTALTCPYNIKPDGLGNYFISEGCVGKITILHPDNTTTSFVTDLNNPNDITFDDQGHLWVTEHYSGKVIELDSTGNKLNEVTGLTPYGPGGIVFWNGSIFVGNPMDASLVRIEKDGSWNYFATGFTGKANPPFIGPGGMLAVGNTLYISDAENLWMIQSVPEPSTFLLLCSGVAGMVIMLRKIQYRSSCKVSD